MKILVVEDSRTMRKIIMVTISLAGYSKAIIREAGDGAEALALVEKDCPDVLITDLTMPNMSGIELIREIKRRKLPVKCGYITGSKDSAQHAEAVAAGAIFNLGKPFTAEQLQKAFRSLTL